MNFQNKPQDKYQNKPKPNISAHFGNNLTDDHFKYRLSDTLYWRRGVAIALVVFGHVIGFDRSSGMRQHYSSDLSWLGILGDYINTIHMPTFFIASGLATDFFSRGVGSYRTFFSMKLPRLLLPLICWAPLYFIFQSLVQAQSVDFVSIASSIYEPYQIFWFLHALIFAVILHFLVKKMQVTKWLYLSGSAVLMGLSFLPLFGSVVVYWYWNFFFALGIILSDILPKMDAWLRRRSLWVWGAIGLLCITTILVTKISFPSHSQLFVVRLLSGIPGFVLLYLLCELSRWIADRIRLPTLHTSVVYLGIMSMVIYLFHGYFTRLSSLLISKSLGHIPPIGYFLILSFIGIVAPLLLNIHALNKSAFLSYITGGKTG